MEHSEDELLGTRLDELESIVDDLRGQKADATVCAEKILMLRLRDAEQALAQREAWLRLSTEAGRIGLLEWNLESGRARFNRMLCTIIGRDLNSEFSTRDWLDIIHPDDRAHVDEALTRAFDCEDYVTFDCRVPVDGNLRWIEYHGKCYRNEDGTPTRAAGAVHDITQHKEAEIALEIAKRKMEDQIAQRTRALHRQTIQLRRLAAQTISSEHRERKRIASVVHDHLQQFLVAAKLQLHLVQRSSDVERLQQAIKKSIMLMEESIEIARGLSHELRPPVLYEDGFIAAMRWLADETFEMHNLHVTVTAAEDVEPSGDDLKSMLFECVRESLFNVVKYAGASEAMITVQRKSADSLCITVSDDGRGFDPELAQHERPGMGLFRIREQLASIDGGMQIVSGPGEGTRIVLRAPSSISPASTSSAAENGNQLVTGPLDSDAPDERIRVLIVDDHVMVREGIAAIIEGPTMTVVGQAADGIEAVDAVERSLPHVILMDLNMPRMNGIDATRAIHQRWPDIAIIGLSVQDDEATAQSLTEAGAIAFVPKGQDPDALFEAILTVV